MMGNGRARNAWPSAEPTSLRAFALSGEMDTTKVKSANSGSYGRGLLDQFGGALRTDISVALEALPFGGHRKRLELATTSGLRSNETR